MTATACSVWRARRQSLALGICLVLAVPMTGVGQVVAPELYVVGGNDVLTVTVFGEQGMTGKYIVEADGAFTFPFIGRVPARGLSVRAIENDLRSRLAKGYLKDPQVAVAVEQHRSQQVFVHGEVRTPGSMPLIGSMTLIEALARVGHLTERAGPELLILRPRPGAPPPDPAKLTADAASVSDVEIIRIDLERLKTGAFAQNVALRADDTIFVPRAETVFVSGQVRSPGEIVIRKGMTVRQVVTLAGDVTDRGSTRRIQIIRRVNGVETKIDAKLQDTVQAGDQIIVRERFL